MVFLNGFTIDSICWFFCESVPDTSTLTIIQLPSSESVVARLLAAGLGVEGEKQAASIVALNNTNRECFIASGFKTGDEDITDYLLMEKYRWEIETGRWLVKKPLSFEEAVQVLLYL